MQIPSASPPVKLNCKIIVRFKTNTPCFALAHYMRRWRNPDRLGKDLYAVVEIADDARVDKAHVSSGFNVAKALYRQL